MVKNGPNHPCGGAHSKSPSPMHGPTGPHVGAPSTPVHSCSVWFMAQPLRRRALETSSCSFFYLSFSPFCFFRESCSSSMCKSKEREEKISSFLFLKSFVSYYITAGPKGKPLFPLPLLLIDQSTFQMCFSISSSFFKIG